MDKVRMGVIGVGGMGSHHARYLLNGEIKRAELTAVCDIDESKLKPFAAVKTFTDSAELIRSGLVDAVAIATPHYFHTTIGIDAMQQGVHVLTEKPISVHKADCERMIAAHKANPKLVFSAMFQLRTEALWKKLKQLIDGGELGEITRVNWIATNWFRTEAYYASGGWRATWSGEGGGILLNQCPHNLDLMQWLFGMPSKIRAFLGFGVKHDIEVEDQVTAYLEYPNGATGAFIVTTGEAPGTDRLEVAGERGKIVVERGKISFTRNEIPMTEFSRTSKTGFSAPPVWHIDVPFGGGASGHAVITQNFVDSILDGSPLIAPAEEGIKSIELANSMIYSQVKDVTVQLPLDSAAYETALKELIANSKFVKKSTVERDEDITSSFKK
jgi:predicted dehydrogenase